MKYLLFELPLFFLYEMCSLQRMKLLAIIPRLQNCTTVQQLNDLMRQVALTCRTEFQFVETYIDRLDWIEIN